ncbi:reverse transcriptase domain-containing protein [Acidobacteriota bacterium]
MAEISRGPGMKRAKNLFAHVVSFDNLWKASRKARRRKRMRASTASFEFNLEEELLRLHGELTEGQWRPGPYRQFFIYEPKRRLISAAPYRDRVVHHAMMNVLEPIFDRGFIHDTYACRKGKGTHVALRRAEAFIRASAYVLQCDIVRFFPSIDHEILYERIARKIGDPKVLRLCRLIIDSAVESASTFEYLPGDNLFSPVSRRAGLPIGNLTSQVWANVYLDALDHHIKESVGVKRYIRYCDDLVCFGNDRKHLWDIRRSINEYAGRLKLRLHDDRPAVFPARSGLTFLGFRISQERTRLKRETVQRFRRRLKKRRQEYEARQISFRQLHCSVQSMIAHVKWSSSFGLRKRLLEPIVFSRGAGPA